MITMLAEYQVEHLVQVLSSYRQAITKELSKPFKSKKKKPGHSDLARCKAMAYDTSPTLGSERTIAIDPSWSSSPARIVVAELRDGFITILLAEEKNRVTYEDLSDYVLDLWHKYQPVSKLYVDSSQVAFIKTIKQMIGEPADYQDQIKSSKVNT